MKYQIRLPEQLHYIESTELSIKTAIKHFSSYGYEYLYVTNNSMICDVLDYHSFISSGLTSSKRLHIVNPKALGNNIEKIEEYFLKNPEITRLAVIESGNLIYEINSMVEPELIHAVEKNLFALRFSDMLYSNINKEFSRLGNILVLASEKTADFIKKRYVNANISVITDTNLIFELNSEQYDAVIDFLCGPKMLKLINTNLKIYDFYRLIEKMMLRLLVAYTNDNNINLKLYRIPNAEELKCLHPEEIKHFNEHKGFIELMKDQEFIRRFSLIDNPAYILERKIIDTIRQDDNICFTQGECIVEGLTVLSGMRFTEDRNAEFSVHFFGPCTVFGMMVSDRYTIPYIFNEITQTSQLKAACAS